MSFRIPGGSQAPGSARRAVLAELDGEWPTERVWDIALIVSELVTNSMLHADVDGDHFITVALEWLADRLQIVVVDPGSALEPRLKPPSLVGSGGFGLFLVDAICTAWGVEHDDHGKTKVWCDLPLELSAAPSRPAA